MSKRKQMGNDYIVLGNITKIITINKQGFKFEILIDTEDLPKIISLKYTWCAAWRKKTQSYYAVASIYQGEGRNNKTVYLHRVIMDAESNDTVDHKESGNTLDNRKCNLRKTTNANNVRNRKGANCNSKTGVRNVSKIWVYNHYEYWVQIMKDGVRYKWEFEENEFERAKEFAEKKRKELFGKFAGKG